MKGIMDGYEQQLYGINADQNTQDWLKDNLQNGRTLSDVRWEDSHSQRMSGAIFTMINGVQDRNDASDAYDGNYKNATMDALGRKEVSFIQNRDNLVNSVAEENTISHYEDQLYGVAADQSTKDWIRDNLHHGRTMQDIRWEDAHSQRMNDAIFNMINGVQDRNDASDAYDANYKNSTMDALGRKEVSFIQNRNNLIDQTAYVAANKMFNAYYGQSIDSDRNWFNGELKSGKTAQQVRWQEAHSDRMKGVLGDKIVSAQRHALTDAQTQTIRSLQDAFGNRLTSSGQFSGALAKAGLFPGTSGSSIGLTVDNIINYFPKIAELGSSAETITVSGIRHLSELGGPLAVVAGVLWPNQSIMSGSEEHSAVLDNLLKEIREKNLREDVKTAILQHNSDLLDKGNLGSGDNPEDKLQVHHLVPVNLDGAGRARSLLVDKWHLSINTLSNASILPQSYHQRVVHGGSGAFRSYSDQVNAVMENADTLADEAARKDGFEAGQAVIRRELREFGRELARDSGDTRAELLQDVISGADILTN